MFQFRRFPSYTYLFSIRSMILHHRCSHIRISADRSLFAAPRSFSQLVTSFVGSQCQGILHMLFFAWTTFVYWSQYTRFSYRLNCCVSYLQFFWQNCFFLPFTEKPDFISFRYTISCFFPLLFCHVCHTNSFELIWFLLFGFQWAFA